MLTIEKLRQAARQSEHSLLSKPVIDADRIDDIAEIFKEEGAFAVDYLDVSLDRIFGLGRKNDFWKEGDNWRALATTRLHGNGWEDDALMHFEYPLRDAKFPAPGAQGRLELRCYDGVYVCSNGNHRLAAGYNWLVANYGDKAILRQAYTSSKNMRRKRVTAAHQLLERRPGSVLSVCKHPTFAVTCELPYQLYYRLEHGEHVEYWAEPINSEDPPIQIWHPNSMTDIVANFLFDAKHKRHLRIQELMQTNSWTVVPGWIIDEWWNFQSK